MDTYKELLDMWISKTNIARGIWVSRSTLWGYEKWDDNKKIKHYFDSVDIKDIVYAIEYRSVLEKLYTFIDNHKDYGEILDDILYDLPHRAKLYIRSSL